MKKPISFITFLTCTILFLSIVQVVVSNRLSTAGTTLGKLQDEIKQYGTKNALLSEKLLIASSLMQIASSAANLGFVEGKSSVILTNPLPLAVKR